MPSALTTHSTQHGALNLRAHRVGGVLRLHLAHELRRGHAAAEPIGAAAGAAAAARTEARPGTRTDAAVRFRFRRRRRCPSPATGSEAEGAAIAPGSESCDAASSFAGMFSVSTGVGSFLAILRRFESRRLLTGTVILSLPGNSASRGGSFILLPPPPPPPPGPGCTSQTI